MTSRERVVSHVLGVSGAAAGAVFGHVLFHWITRQGFYALIVPGGMLGLGCNLLARHPSVGRGLACGAAALALGVYSDWTFEQFPADDSLRYYLTHLNQLRPVTLLMIGAGGVIAYVLGKDAGYGRPPRPDRGPAGPRR